MFFIVKSISFEIEFTINASIRGCFLRSFAYLSNLTAYYQDALVIKNLQVYVEAK